MKQYKEMLAEVLFKLPVGAQFRVSWDKDDNPDYRRLYYTIQTVEFNDGVCILADRASYEWTQSEVIEPKSNQLDTSRGIAYFFYL